MLSHLDYCNSLLSGLPASSVHSLHRIQNCAAHLILKTHNTDHASVSISSLAPYQTKNFVQNKHSITSINVSQALLCLISVTVFNFTTPHTSYTPLFLILSASRFLLPDSPLLVPAPFLFSVYLHGMTIPSFNRNPVWTHSNVTEKHVFPKL